MLFLCLQAQTLLDRRIFVCDERSMAKKTVLQAWIDGDGMRWLQKRLADGSDLRASQRTVVSEMSRATGLNANSIHACRKGKRTGTLVAAAIADETGLDFRALCNLDG